MKTPHCSVQKGTKLFGEKGKDSAIKETRNLAIKNYFFGEVDYNTLLDEDKPKALPLLLFIIRNEIEP